MVFPSGNAHRVEIVLALPASFEILSLFVHLGEANGAIRVAFEVNILCIFFIGAEPRFQAFSKLLIDLFIGGLGNRAGVGFDITKQLIVLSHLSDDEEDMLTWFFLHAVIKARAL